MTSRHWKERREKEAFIVELRDFANTQTVDMFGATLDEEYERMYAEDVANGLFDDDYDDDLYWDEDDWEDDTDYPFDYGWDDDDEGDTRLKPGNHVRDYTGEVWLVLDDYRWANLLTGKVMWKGSFDIELGGFLAVDGVIIYSVGYTSDVVMFEANPKEYKELGRFTAPSIRVDYPSECWTPPAIADGKLFIRRKQMLACFDLR